MLNYVIKRLLGLIPTLLIVAVLVFLFVHMPVSYTHLTLPTTERV